MHIKHDDLAQPRQLIADFEHFVQLLVVFHEKDDGVRVFTEVLNLCGGVRWIDPTRDAPAGQDRQIRKDPLDDRIGQDGGPLAAPIAGALGGAKTQAEQAAPDLFDLLSGLVPAPTAPETELFLTHPDPISTAFGRVPEERRNRLAREINRGSVAQLMEVPKITHVPP